MQQLVEVVKNNFFNIYFFKILDEKYPVLIADIGGTNVRLSLLRMSKDKSVAPEQINTDKLSPAKFPSLQELLKEYLSKVKPEDYPLYAVFGIPGPVKNNEVMGITNIPHWPKFSGEEMANLFKIKKFVLLNDFTCNGYGVQCDLKLNEDFIPLNSSRRRSKIDCRTWNRIRYGILSKRRIKSILYYWSL